MEQKLSTVLTRIDLKDLLEHYTDKALWGKNWTIYVNGTKAELGIVKKVCGDDEYFVNYHTGDTAARTHARHLVKVSNRYAYHIIRLDPNGNERKPRSSD